MNTTEPEPTKPTTIPYADMCQQCMRPETDCQCTDSWRPMVGGVSLYPLILASLLLSSCNHASNGFEGENVISQSHRFIDWLNECPEMVRVPVGLGFTAVVLFLVLGAWGMGHETGSLKQYDLDMKEFARRSSLKIERQSQQIQKLSSPRK